MSPETIQRIFGSTADHCSKRIEQITAAREATAKYSFRIAPKMDFDSQTLQFTTEIDGMTKQITRESVCFKEKAVREMLIALGWTPPVESP